MAKCKLCKRSGWFLGKDKDGICTKCQKKVNPQKSEVMRLLDEYTEHIRNSKKLDTTLFYYKLGLMALENLKMFEDRGISTIDPPPSQAIQEWREERAKKVLEPLNTQRILARSKSENAITVSGKIEPFSKVLEQVTEYQIQFEDIDELQEFEHEVRKEIADTIAHAHLHEAEKAEFKGQNKKALEIYLEALFSIRKDNVPDDEQSQLIEKIESKIEHLGGTVPR
ncbi:hypothetical protein [Sediminicurvatus halobius]|uniref:hypothetical protein n=1 Tax=Sediminicurvatus halobius TaxID=2182432 RepID=UPI0011B1E8F6|nr:hypothetical protein [Spiribacter halobius]UEX79755.1 hypothetical protein LMH63_08945 [Spiribacter halobius]